MGVRRLRSSRRTLADRPRRCAAPSVTATSGPGYTRAAEMFAGEVMDECRLHGGDARLGVERMDFQVTDTLRGTGFSLSSATRSSLARG